MRPAYRRLGPRLALCTAFAALPLALSVQAQDAPGGTTSVQVSEDGRMVYEEICQSCHMADAKGGGGAGAAIPSLAGNANLADKDLIVSVIVNGRGGMPWFTDILNEQQIAAVSTYVRSHFNAYPEPVSVADVRRIASGSGPVRDCNTCQ